MKFSEVKTVSGYAADEVISALQKEIRRGRLETAAYFALELLESGFEEKVWERLMVIAVEDVADSSCAVKVHALRENYKELGDAKPWDKHMQVIKAVQMLVEAKKDRIVSELYDYLQLKRKEGYKPAIPKYALDMHTKKGKEEGKDYLHFLEVSSKVTNEQTEKNTFFRDYLKQHHTKK
jgi:replication-associated recombination protein RarA